MIVLEDAEFRNGVVLRTNKRTVKVIMELHMQTLNAVFELADELNMDSKEVFSMYVEIMNSEEGRAVAANTNIQ